MSTKTGLKPFNKTELISDTQVNVGTIISFLNLFLFSSFKIAIVKKIAEEPELTYVEYLTPNHFDHCFSNFSTCLD